MTMKRVLFLFSMMILFTAMSFGQNSNRFPIWTFHERDVTIHGISVGLLSAPINERNTNTNGIRLELIGLGIFAPMIPSFPTFEEQRSERINGLNLSALGTMSNSLINGLSIGGGGQIHYQVNGLSLSMMMNLAEKQNGVMIAGMNMTKVTNGLQIGLANMTFTANGVQAGFALNEAETMRGLQIGMVNRTENLRGIQIGLWNVNQKRTLPLLNWNFRRTEKQEVGVCNHETDIHYQTNQQLN